MIGRFSRRQLLRPTWDEPLALLQFESREQGIILSVRCESTVCSIHITVKKIKISISMTKYFHLHMMKMYVEITENINHEQSISRME